MLRSEIAEGLRALGHDVLSTRDTGQSVADDRKVLEFAVQEGRVLITLDRHFGDWAVLPLSKHAGVIRLKVHPPETGRLMAVLERVLQTQTPEDFHDHLVIAGPASERWINTANLFPN
jgi:predicted nuclease of predicted toxin-antitoxin system